MVLTKYNLDGSYGLEIGDHISILTGVQIYSHHTVFWSTSLGSEPVNRHASKIGNGVYVGASSVIQIGTTIGDNAVIGVMSFVNKDIPNESK